MSYRYYLQVPGDGSWHEVTKAEFVSAERQAGFINTLNQPHEPATAGFSAGEVRGKVVWESEQ